MDAPHDSTTVEDGLDADWSGHDLEDAYRRALEALETSEAVLPDAQPVSDEPAAPPAVSSAPSLSRPSPVQPPVPEPAVTAEQIIEACLFVGGAPLTARKLLGVLRVDAEPSWVEAIIDGLNERYASQNRPYAIRLVEGGYVLALHSDYDRIRAKVFGLGPKEVRLSQEALEVLAVVAYQQPISQRGIEELGRPQCGGVLRQLLRRELIAIERGQPREIRYRTTPRFLSLFGIGSLEDLPRPEQLLYK